MNNITRKKISGRIGWMKRKEKLAFDKGKFIGDGSKNKSSVSGGTQMKWRSLKNPPPVEKEHVLVSIQEHIEYGTLVEAKVMEAFCLYENNGKLIWFKQDGSGLNYCNNVTHWQPLPKIFK